MPRDLPPRAEPGRVTGVTGAKPRSEGRQETESLSASAEWRADEAADEGQLAPLASAAMGTHDRPPTRLESPVARRPPSGARSPRPSAPPPPSNERPEDRIGTTLGAYRLHALIGKGGMGFVYRAEHARLGREVALKLLRADYARRRESVSRFFQEARTVNRIRHRNIVDVTDFVELDDGTTFIIMELLRGQSLGSWSRHAFDPIRALGLLIQICDGLAAAHAVGVIHRDLKPDNVVVMPTGDGAEMVKLLDFGVAKLLNRDDEDVGLETAAGSVIGTPAYMSPEQAGGLPIDARADIYSLGAIMYELFTGQPLFRGRSFGEYVRKHLSEPPFPPRQTPRGATLDPRLEYVLLRCLEKEPARRFQSVEELRQELLEILGGLETHDGPPAGRGRTTGRSSGRVEPPHRTGETPRPTGPHVEAAPYPQPPPGPGYPPTPYPQPMMAPTPYPQPMMAPTPYPQPTPYPGALVSLGDPSLALRPRRWAWATGAAVVAIGLGVAGALVAAARGRDPEPAREATPTAATTPTRAATPTAPATGPTISPAIEATGTAAPSAATPGAATAGATTATPTITGGAPADTPPPRPAALEVRIDAPAGARVTRAGADVTLCVAPCSLAIDPADGDDPARRDYVVRLDGFADQTVAIDLAAPPPSIAVSFDAPADAPGDERTGRRRTGRPGPTPPTATVEPPRATDPPPVETTRPADGPARKPRPTVDPTETIDPFAPR